MLKTIWRILLAALMLVSPNLPHLLGLPQLLAHVGLPGLVWMVLGGVMYSIGAVLYGLGKRKKYRHCVFHIFCLLGTFCHFWAIYVYLL